MERAAVLVEFRDVSLRFGKTVTLSHMDWQLRANEHWGVLGDNGAGKTSFLSLVRGDLHPAPEAGQRLYHANGKQRTSPVGFRETTGLVSCDLLDRYRQSGWNLSGLDVVCTGFRGTAFLYDRPTPRQVERSHELLTLLGLTELAGRSVLTMSLGQARKILIARALVHHPRVLFLDEVCAGLDAVSSATVLELLQQAVEAGTQIVYATHEQAQLPSIITHVLRLRSGRVAYQGPLGGTPAKKEPAPRLNVPPALEGDRRQITHRDQSEHLVLIRDAQVWMSGRQILRDLNWTMRRGENWAVFGRNGAGKTTFLHLIAGEVRPAWGGLVQRFGYEDPPTVREIRRRIGFVSPDLQSSHVCSQSAMELVLSGFYGSIGLHAEPSPEQLAVARSWFGILQAEHLQDQDVRTLSYGQLRILLILRAIVVDPDILLLDEPTSGLDAKAGGAVLAALDRLARSGIGLVYVTHDAENLPSSITHVAVLEEGLVVFQGNRSDASCDHR
jgi:molybdate transport system ATP-binding protein